MPNVQKHKKTDGFLKILMVRVLDCLIKIYQKSTQKRSRKQTFICDGFLIDFGPILEPFWGRKSKENRSKNVVDFYFPPSSPASVGGTKSFQLREKTAAIDRSRGVRFRSAQELYLTPSRRKVIEV